MPSRSGERCTVRWPRQGRARSIGAARFIVMRDGMDQQPPRDFSGAACCASRIASCCAAPGVSSTTSTLPGVLHAAFVRSPVAHGHATAHRRRRGPRHRRRACRAHLCRPAAADDLRPHSAGAAVGGDPLRCRARLARRRRGLPCRRARRDGGGGRAAASPRTPPAWSRSTSSRCRRWSIRSRRSRRAHRGRGSTARTISSRAPRSTTATSTPPSPAPRIGSPSASISTRAAAIRSSRAA